MQRCFNRDGANPATATPMPAPTVPAGSADGRIDEPATDKRNHIETSGVDTGRACFDKGGMGSLNFNLVSTWVEKYGAGTTVSASDPIYEFVGRSARHWLGDARMAPRADRHAVDALSLTAVARYTDEMFHSNTITGGVGTGTDSIWYFDLRGTFDLTSNLTLRAGVNNVADTEPELYTPNVQANTDPSTYDVLGRRFFVGFNLRM